MRLLKKNSGKHQALWGREIQVKEEWKFLWPAWSHSTPRLRTSLDADISRALSTGQIKERLSTEGRLEKSRGFVASTECSWYWSGGLTTHSFPLILTISYFFPSIKLSKRHLRVMLSQSRYWKGITGFHYVCLWLPYSSYSIRQQRLSSVLQGRLHTRTVTTHTLDLHNCPNDQKFP